MKLLGSDVDSTAKLKTRLLVSEYDSLEKRLYIPYSQVLQENMHQDIWAWFLLISQKADAVNITAICCAIEASLNLFNAYIIENMMSTDAFCELCMGRQSR